MANNGCQWIPLPCEGGATTVTVNIPGLTGSGLDWGAVILDLANQIKDEAKTLYCCEVCPPDPASGLAIACPQVVNEPPPSGWEPLDYSYNPATGQYTAQGNYTATVAAGCGGCPFDPVEV